MTLAIDHSNVNRRQFLKHSGSVAAGAAVLGSLTPTLFAAEDDTIRLALIGCGGRGTGAVGDALSVPDSGPVKLYAMADLDPKRMEHARKALQESSGDKVDVSDDRKFVGFDAYRQAIDSLAARRHRHVHHAGLHPAGPRRVRRQEGHQRLHGEAVRARSGRPAPAAPRGRGGREEGRQDRRRAPVPPLARPGRH